jgi:hypothetical protein
MTEKKATTVAPSRQRPTSLWDSVQHPLSCVGVETHDKQTKKEKTTQGGARRRLATTAPEPYTCNHRAGGALLRTPPASTASEQASTASSVEGERAVGAHPRRAVGEGSHVFSPPDPRLPLEGARPAAAVGSASPWCSDRLRGERAAVELGPPPPNPGAQVNASMRRCGEMKVGG